MIEGDEASPVERREDDPLTLLTLGDGDFSWSVDLAHHLATTSPSKHPIKLIATGFDSEDEIHAKYRNTACWLREFHQHAAKAPHVLSVEVRHAVNAVQPSSAATPLSAADLVLFHHPHLGTEDAKRHASFLCHLFYTVRETWLQRSRGHFYLTLAAGQWERWECATAAARHGFVLHERWRFRASAHSQAARYEHRRHQTGKSFRARTEGSTTYHYVHASNVLHRNPPIQLPWFEPIGDNESSQLHAAATMDSFFSCPECDRTFAQERWLLQHVRAKHAKATTTTTQSSFPCPTCDRTFQSPAGLQDHQRAMHAGIHTGANLLQPDWSAAVLQANRATDPTTATELVSSSPRCSICDAPRHDDSWLLPHTPPTIPCTFCRRTFASWRAQRQHENVCTVRVSAKKAKTSGGVTATTMVITSSAPQRSIVDEEPST